jgi:hypothetical protein
MTGTDSNLLIIGIYESARVNYYPTHASPILAENCDGGYRRWNYQIQRPYKIIPIAPLRDHKKTIPELFPHPTFIQISPREFRPKSQCILLNPDVIIIDDNILRCLFRMIIYLPGSIFYKEFSIKRFAITVYNIFIP